MPRRDGTGPFGEGPRTGQGYGSCPPAEPVNPTPERPIRETEYPPRRGMGYGRGMGFRRGWGWRRYAE